MGKCPGAEICGPTWIHEQTRPCVSISGTTTSEWRRTLVVIPLSSSAQAAPPLTIRAGQKVVAAIDQVRALSKERLTRHIKDLPTDQLEAVEAGLPEILELD